MNQLLGLIRNKKYLITLFCILNIGLFFAQSPGGVEYGTVRGYRFARTFGWFWRSFDVPGSGNIYGYTGRAVGHETQYQIPGIFGVSYTGKLNVPNSGNWCFQFFNTRQWVDLSINGVNVVDKQTYLVWRYWRVCVLGYCFNVPYPWLDFNSDKRCVWLNSGDHDIRIRFANQLFLPNFELIWEGPGVASTTLDSRWVRVDNQRLSYWYKASNVSTFNFFGNSAVLSWQNMATSNSSQNLNRGWFNLPAYRRMSDGTDILVNYNPAARFVPMSGYITGWGIINSSNNLVYQNGPFHVFNVTNYAFDHGGNKWQWGKGGICYVGQQYGSFKNDAGNTAGWYANTVMNNVLAFGVKYEQNEPKIEEMYHEANVGGGSSNPTRGARNNGFLTFNTANNSDGRQMDIDANGITLGFKCLSGYDFNNGGEVPEFIYYPFKLTNSESEKVNTYLAVKYGVHLLDINYVRTDGTIIWNTSTRKAEGFHNRVFGIGREWAVENLNQKQSQSRNRLNGDLTSEFIKVAKNSLAKNNDANTGVLPEGAYLLMGDNNALLKADTNEIPPSLVATVCGVERLLREWKVSSVGNPGSVSFQVGSSTAGFLFTPFMKNILLVVDEDKDADFTTGNVRVYPAISVNKGVATFNNVTLNHDEVFTFVWGTAYPGGVKQNLVAWTAASLQNESIQSGDFIALDSLFDVPNNANYPSVGTKRAILIDGTETQGLNYNPALKFDSSVYLNRKNSISFTSGLTSFNVVKFDSANFNETLFDFSNFNNFTTNVLVKKASDKDSMQLVIKNSSNIFATTSNSNFFDNGKPISFSITNEQGLANAPTTSSLYKRGQIDRINTASQVPALGYSYRLLGAAYTSGSIIPQAPAVKDRFKGEMYEHIVYNRVLTNTEMAKVNSYLAIKYSQPIANGSGNVASNYLSTQDIITWQGNPNYKYNMFGIGRDDCTGLDQRQSKSFEIGEKTNVKIALGAVNPSGNIENLNNFSSDQKFLIMGSLLDSADFQMNTSVGVPPAYAAQSCNPIRWQQSYLVQNTNNVDSIQMRVGDTRYNAFSITAAMARVRLAVKLNGDNDFSTGTVNLIKPTRIERGEAIFDNLTLPHNSTWTIVWTGVAPGGDTSNLELWLNAFDGPSSINDSTRISKWNDLSPRQYHGIAPSTVSNQPFYHSGSNSNYSMNYNPTVRFVSSSRFQLPNGFADFSKGMTTYTMARPTGSGSINEHLFYFGTNATNFHHGLSLSRTTPAISQDSAIFRTYPASATTSVNSANASVITTSTPFKFLATNKRLIGTNLQSNSTGTTNRKGDILVDGFLENSNSTFNTPDNITRTQNFIGSRQGGSNAFIGLIPEVIVYSKESSPLQLAKVNTYLAIKYGLTLRGSTPVNYVNTDGTVVWDGTANLGFNNDITGIAYDECTALNQVQSTSTDGNDILTIGLDSITTENKFHFSPFLDNKSYIIFGHDSGDLYQLQPTGVNLPSSLTSLSDCYQKLGRVWKASVTGPQHLNLTIKIGKQDFFVFNKTFYKPKLLISSSPTDFTNARVYDYSKNEDGIVTFDSVEVRHNEYMSVAIINSAPGGVNTGVALWLDAFEGPSPNIDGSAITDWKDLTLLGNNAVGPTGPIYRGANSDFAINFNPTVTFNGVDQNIEITKNAFRNFTNGLSIHGVYFNNITVGPNSADATIFNTGLDNRIFIERGISSNNLNLGISNNGISSSSIGTTSNPFVLQNGPQLFGYNMEAGTSTQTNRNQKVYLNGAKEVENNNGTIPTLTDRNQNNFIGRGLSISSFLNGTLPEFVVYNRALLDIEIQKIYSYFAIKYGRTLNQNTPTDYLASNGLVVWNSNTNIQYNKRIFGIGRDDCDALSQRISKSTEPGSIVKINYSDQLYTSNKDHEKQIPVNRSFLMIGDNGKSLYWSGEDIPTSGNARLNRVWRVQKTGTIGPSYVMAPHSSSTFVDKLPAVDSNENLYLLVARSSTGGVFASATGVEEVVMDTAFTGGYWKALYDFQDGDYFTFSTRKKCLGPVGITENLSSWYSSNLSVSNDTTDSLAITTLKDLGLKSLDATTTSGPIFRLGNSSFASNFNPTLTFNGTSQFLDIPSASFNLTKGFTTFSVLNNNIGSIVADARVLHLSNGPSVDVISINRQTSTPNFGVSIRSGALSSTIYLNNDSFKSTSGIGLMTTRMGSGNEGQTNIPQSAFYNGKLIISNNTGIIPNTLVRNQNRIGKISGTGSEYYNGSMPELAYYESDLSEVQLQKINTYLALKYGLTLNHNYYSASYNGVNGDTTTLYDVSSYNHRIMGIGRDDLGCFEQKQSKSSMASNFITISTMDTMKPSNKLNTRGLLVDRSYLVVGDNDSSIKWVHDSLAAEKVNLFIPNNCDVYRIPREWKATATGEGISFSVHIPADSSTNPVRLDSLPSFKHGVFLVMNDNPDFSVNADLQVQNVQYDAVNKAFIGTIQVPKNTTKYFTLVSYKYRCGRSCIFINPFLNSSTFNSMK